MTLHYYGPEIGYVDSRDRAEIAAIAVEAEVSRRARRVSRRLGEDLGDGEAYRVFRARQPADRLAERAALRRKGGRLVKCGIPGLLHIAVSLRGPR